MIFRVASDSRLLTSDNINIPAKLVVTEKLISPGEKAIPSSRKH